MNKIIQFLPNLLLTETPSCGHSGFFFGKELNNILEHDNPEKAPQHKNPPKDI